MVKECSNQKCKYEFLGCCGKPDQVQCLDEIQKHQVKIDGTITFTMKPPQPPKLYPHKFFVQFHRNSFHVPSSEMGTFTKSNRETITYSKDLCFRILTFCTIHPIDTAKWFCGQAVLNPVDTDNIVRGCKEAFSHAVLECFANTLRTIDWGDFAKLFFDALLKKNLTDETILNGFVLKVKLPWEAKKHGH